MEFRIGDIPVEKETPAADAPTATPPATPAKAAPKKK